jgi:type III restriction enzyme
VDPDVRTDLNRPKVEPQIPLPDLVTNAYMLLGLDWQDAAHRWKAAGVPTPPVMITVANRTETAARVKYAFDHDRIGVPELCDPDRTLHIDSKVLEKAEEREEAPVAEQPSGADEEEAEGLRPGSSRPKSTPSSSDTRSIPSDAPANQESRSRT